MDMANNFTPTLKAEAEERGGLCKKMNLINFKTMELSKTKRCEMYIIYVYIFEILYIYI